MSRLVIGTYNYLSEYLAKVRAQGRYYFTVDEVKEHFSMPYTTVRQSIFRLKYRNEIALIRKGFYVIIPPEYSKQGMLPPYLYMDDLMKFLGKSYYVGLSSAAAMYGAAHQQPMGYSVITQTPAPRNIEKLKIDFFAKKELIEDGIVQQKTPAGYINVSSPELTALDLFDYLHKFGINRIATILEELTEAMKPSALLKIAKLYPNTAAVQRLGYVLENMGADDKLIGAIEKAFDGRTLFPVPLSPHKGKTGAVNDKWKVIINMEIESDL
jgi:predicted transcriptional regulator of viral defense system